jgi:hypothetical protein
MDEASRFVKIADEIFTWGGALPALLRRIGEATKMPGISDADKMALAATSKRIGDLFQKVEKALDAGNTNNLATIADELRDEVVKENVILDRLKVPDSE